MNSFRPASHLRHFTAVTMVELIMAMAVGVVLFATILTLLVHTQRASDRVILREQMMQDALVIEHKLGGILGRAVPDARLTASGLPASRFTAEAIEFYAAGDKLERWTVSAEPAGGGENAPVQVAARRDGVEAGALTGAGAALPMGVGFDKFDSVIKFQFANEYDGLTPQWSTSSDAAPRVIRYTIIISDPRDRAVPVMVSNSVRWPDLD